MFTHEMIALFNELETSLYNYISQNSEKVVYMRIRELANETHVSTASILRFCKKINCEGFSEFKVKLKMYTEANKKTILKSPHHSVAEFFERTVSGGMEEKLKEAQPLRPMQKASFLSEWEVQEFSPNTEPDIFRA